MNSKGIQQTSDLVVAAASIWQGVQKAQEDGKISTMEAVKLAISNFNEVLDACSGIGEVWGELADIQPEEIDALYVLTMTRLGWEQNTLNSSRFNAIFSFVHAGVQSWRTLENLSNPPKAVVVPEP